MMYVLSLQCGQAWRGDAQDDYLALGALSGLWWSVQRKWQGTGEANNFLATFGCAPWV